MHTAILNEDTGLAMKLKTRHFAVLGVTATFLAIRLLENLVPTLAGSFQRSPRNANGALAAPFSFIFPKIYASQLPSLCQKPSGTFSSSQVMST